MPYVAATDRGAMATVYADGGYGYAATGDLSPAGLAAALERAAHWARVTARRGAARHPSLPLPAPRGDYASPALGDREPSRARLVRPAARRIGGRRAAIRASSTGRRASRSARPRTGWSPAPAATSIQRYRFLMPGLSVTAHADGETQTRTLNGYHGFCQQGGLEVLDALRLRGGRPRDRRGGARAARRAELPERHDGRAADARPDDAADPRVDRPSAGARPHPRRRAQLRRHELRDAGHVRQLPVRLASCSTSPSTRRARRSSRATPSTTTARAAEKVHLIRNGMLERPLGGAISQARAGLPGRGQRARRQLEPAADRPHGQPQPRAGRRVARRADRRHRARRADGDQLLVVDRRLAQQVPVRLRVRPRDRERQADARGEESELPRHLARTSGAASRASATPTRSRCWARRTAARASRRR